MISRGFAGGGESSSTRKAHLRSIRSVEITEVQVVSKIPRLDTSITFSDSDLEGCQHSMTTPCNSSSCGQQNGPSGLVDNGSSANIILASAFDKIGIGGREWNPSAPICEDSLEKRYYLGLNTTSTHLGDPPCQATTTTRFLVVDSPSA